MSLSGKRNRALPLEEKEVEKPNTKLVRYSPKSILKKMSDDVFLHHVVPYLSEDDVVNLSSVSPGLHRLFKQKEAWKVLYLSQFQKPEEPFLNYEQAYKAKVCLNYVELYKQTNKKYYKKMALLAYKRAFFSFGQNDVELFADFSIDVFSSLYGSHNEYGTNFILRCSEYIANARNLYDVITQLAYYLELSPKKFLIAWLKHMADSGNAQAALAYAAQIHREISMGDRVLYSNTYNMYDDFWREEGFDHQYAIAKKYYLQAWNDSQLSDAAIGLGALYVLKPQDKKDIDDVFRILLIAAKTSSEALIMLANNYCKAWKKDPLKIWILQNTAILGPEVCEPKDFYKHIMQSINDVGVSVHIHCAAALLSAIVDKDMSAAIKSLRFALAIDSSVHEKYLAVGEEHGLCKDIHKSTMKELMARINSSPVMASQYFFRRPRQPDNLQVESKPASQESFQSKGL